MRNPRHRLVSTGQGSISATGARRGETPGERIPVADNWNM